MSTKVIRILIRPGIVKKLTTFIELQNIYKFTETRSWTPFTAIFYPVHNLTIYLFNQHFDVIYPSTPNSSK